MAAWKIGVGSAALTVDFSDVWLAAELCSSCGVCGFPRWPSGILRDSVCSGRTQCVAAPLTDFINHRNQDAASHTRCTTQKKQENSPYPRCGSDIGIEQVKSNLTILAFVNSIEFAKLYSNLVILYSYVYVSFTIQIYLENVPF